MCVCGLKPHLITSCSLECSKYAQDSPFRVNVLKLLYFTSGDPHPDTLF